MTIVFNKIGDFYEATGEAARVVAKELTLTLTRGRITGLPMVGIPYHAINRDVDQLRSNGHEVIW